MESDVEAAFAEMSGPLRAHLLEIRALIFGVAQDCGVGPLTETLKWGQPAYLTQASKAGTTIRLGQHKGHPGDAALFVNCQTSLIDEFGSLFADELRFEGNRAVLVRLENALPKSQLGSCIRLALTYHRRKKTGGV